MSVSPKSAEALDACEPADERAEEKAAPADEQVADSELEAPGLRVLRSPSDPTSDEIELHEAAGHSPYRAWCRACVAGAGRTARHEKPRVSEEKCVPVICVDYAFMGEKGDENQVGALNMPILVCKCLPDRWVSADAIPSKGTAEPYGAQRLAEEIVKSGFPRIILKSDGEPAIIEMKREAVKRAREEVAVEVIFEESHAYVSQTNGVVEQAVGAIEAKTRTLKFATEELHGVKLEPNSPVLTWAVAYAGQMMSRAHRYSSDGRTAYELRKGKPYKRRLPVFGEKVLAMSLGKRRLKSEYRTFEAIYLGLAERSDMLIVGNADGCQRVATVKRLPPSSRRDAELIKALKGVPWRPRPGVAQEPGAQEVPVCIHADPVVRDDELPQKVKPRSCTSGPRRVYIRRDKELKKYGYTVGCPGCDAARANLSGKDHTEACRERIQSKMEEDEESKRRLDEATARLLGARGVPPPSRTEVQGAGQQRPEREIPPESGADQDAASRVREAPPDDEQMSKKPRTDPKQGVASQAREAPPSEEQPPKRQKVAEDEIMQVENAISAWIGRVGSGSSALNFFGDPEKRAHGDGVIPPSFILDLTEGWSMRTGQDRERASGVRTACRPRLLIGSLETPDAAQSSFLAAEYAKQVDEGLYYLHEEPPDQGSVRELGSGAIIIEAAGEGDMTYATNHPAIAEALWTGPRQADEQSGLRNPRARARLVKAVVDQLERDAVQGDGQLQLFPMEIGTHVDEESIKWDKPPEYQREFYDEISGALLDPELVKRARAKEIEFIKEFEVYKKVPAEDAIGKAKVSLKWCDVNKGDDTVPEYRSRLVARELKAWDPSMTGTFAATPPTESLRFMLSRFATRQQRGVDNDLKMLVLDISRAHFHPPAKREIYVDLPEEDAEDGKVGLLTKTMYGTRDAAAEWEEYYRRVFTENGFECGVFCPCLFWSSSRGVSVWVHGDDMILLGTKAAVEAVEELLAESMLVKRRGLLGWGSNDDKRVTLLNRIIELHDYLGGRAKTLTYEPDPRHVEIILRSLNLDAKAKSVVTPAVRTKPEGNDDEPLAEAEVRDYRSTCMRIAFLAQDLPHLLYASKEIARKMQKPTRGAFAAMKRIGRFLKGAPRCIQTYHMQDPCGELVVLSDSDFAGCMETRKSTSACFLYHGEHLIRATSSTQGIQGLSSGESEFMALVRATSIGLGAQAMAKDLGVELTLSVKTDSSAAHGVAHRRGVGKIRHLHTPLLWIQQCVKTRGVRLSKVPGTINWSDLGTKPVDRTRMAECLAHSGFRFVDGRSTLALRAAT